MEIFQGERITTMRSLEQSLLRKIKRLKAEKTQYESIIQNQLSIIDSLNINSYNFTGTLSQNQDENKPKYSYQKYQNITSDTVLNNIQRITDFNIFFDDTPITLSSFYDPSFTFDFSKFGYIIQNWQLEQKFEFYSKFADSLHYIAYQQDVLYSLLTCDTTLSLTEMIESKLPSLLGYKIALLFTFDKDNRQLLLEKQMIYMKYKIKSDSLFNSLALKTTVFLDSSEMEPLMKEKKMALIVPSKTQPIVLALFDKNGNISVADDLRASSCMEFISELWYTISVKNRKSEKVTQTNRMSQIFIELSGKNGVHIFIETLKQRLTDEFKCKHLSLFKVSAAREAYHILNSKKPPIKLSIGLTGAAIMSGKTAIYDHPENLHLFEPIADRYSEDVVTTSMMVTPIFDDSRKVKWAIVMYNKDGSFTDEDAASLEILTKQFNRILLSIIELSQLNQEMSSSNNEMTEMINLAAVVEYVPSIWELIDLSDVVLKRIKCTIDCSRVSLYTVQRKQNHKELVSTDEMDDYCQELSMESDDSLVKITLSNQYQEQKCGRQSIIYCPIFDSIGNINGLIKLEPSESWSGGMSTLRSGRTLMSMISMSTVSVSSIDSICKKVATASVKSNSLTRIKNHHLLKTLYKWSKLVGSVVEAMTTSASVRRQVLIEQRLYELSLNLKPDDFLKIWAWANPNGPHKEQNQYPIYPEQFTSLVRAITSIPSMEHLQNYKQDADVAAEIDNSISFPDSIVFDASEYDNMRLMQCITTAMANLGILELTGLDFYGISHLVQELKLEHDDRPFTNWKLAIDHVQFFTIIAKKVNLTPEENTAIFLFLLACNAREEGNSASWEENLAPETAASRIFRCLAANESNPFFDIPADIQRELFNKLILLEETNYPECSVSTDLMVITCFLSRYSYLARHAIIREKLEKARFAEELSGETSEDAKELKKYQMEFETRILVQSALAELTKQGIDTESMRRSFIIM